MNNQWKITMPNLIEVTYAQTGESTSTNEMGMRVSRQLFCPVWRQL